MIIATEPDFLEVTEFCVGRAISRYALVARHDPQFVVQQEANELVMALYVRLAGRVLPTKTTEVRIKFSRPRTWWDAFKESHPKLCARLEPPAYVHEYKTETVTLDARVVYPDVLPHPRYGDRVFFDVR